MSKCTAFEAIEAAKYWLGYCEKNSEKWVEYRSKKYFTYDAGDGNYTYMGYVCGINPGAWCAMFVTTAILEACNNDEAAAREIMYGVFPYTSCGQIWDVCGENAVTRLWAIPRVGDIIIFSNDGQSRDHTGLVYKVDSEYVYTIEGNSHNKCMRRQYWRGDSWIYGYIHPAYAEALDDTIGPVDEPHYDRWCNPSLPELSKGNAGEAVYVLQYALIRHGVYPYEPDGIFGPATQSAVKRFQTSMHLTSDGIVGVNTWSELLSD